MDDAMMLFLFANVFTLIQLAAAFVAVLVIAIAICVAAITVFS